MYIVERIEGNRNASAATCGRKQEDLGPAENPET